MSSFLTALQHNIGKHGYTRCIFPPAARLTRDTLETRFFTIWHLGVPFVSHQNLGDSEEIWEKFFWGSVANKYLGKVTEAFQKIPSSFGAVVRIPGLGGKLPPPLATQGLMYDDAVLSVVITQPLHDL